MVGRLITGILLALSFSQVAHTQPLSDAITGPLTVVWCDRAGLSSTDLIQALAEVDRIVQSAHLQVRWLETETCIGPKLDSYFSIIITPRRPKDFPASAEAAGRSTLVGTAYPRAYIFFDEVQRFDRANRAATTVSRPGVILGHAMAHELGHLLGFSHTQNGIMRPRWGREEWHLAQAGMLVFTRSQVKLAKHSN